MTNVYNIMTVDLEDYYCDLPFSMWDRFSPRVIETTKPLLRLFEKYKVHATFFTVAYIAERHPELIEEIKSKGHEIASHGYFHRNIKNMDKETFESELVQSLEVLRKVSGEPIHGFRAPFFSIDKQNFWAFDVIRKYLLYDSSLFPVKFHYGLPEERRYVYRMSHENPLNEDSNSDFIELPLTTLRVPILGNIPCAGGIYMRFFPYQLIKTGFERFNKVGVPAIFYIHPADLDTAMPRVQGYGWHYYWGLNRAYKKFESLLKRFRFSSVQEALPSLTR